MFLNFRYLKLIKQLFLFDLEKYLWTLDSFFCILQSSLFQNEDIFFQLDELDELDRFTHVWIRLYYSFTQAQKTFWNNG